ncbi:MAG TPA: hypothetical protein DEV72_13020 [Ktedonobacter sp.]|jgi:hypothetical protein|nr:hypothetical protein [Ktedonobacter sp.]
MKGFVSNGAVLLALDTTTTQIRPVYRKAISIGKVIKTAKTNLGRQKVFFFKFYGMLFLAFACPMLFE